MAVENHIKQHISLPSFNYLDEAEDWVKKQECIVEQAGYYTYTIYEVRTKRNHEDSSSKELNHNE